MESLDDAYEVELPVSFSSQKEREEGRNRENKGIGRGDACDVAAQDVTKLIDVRKQAMLESPIQAAAIMALGNSRKIFLRANAVQNLNLLPASDITFVLKLPEYHGPSAQRCCKERLSAFFNAWRIDGIGVWLAFSHERRPAH